MTMGYPVKTLEARVAVLEAAVERLQRALLSLSKPSAIRKRGPRSKLDDEEWLAQRKQLAANARKKRWAGKKKTTQASKAKSR